MEELKQFLIEQNKKTFLDIGTGNGGFIAFIKSLYDGFESFVGIDVIDRFVKAASDHNSDERIQFKVMDATDMDYSDNSFDVVCLSNSLHHLDDISLMLKEMKRVVKKDGFILINEMVSNDLDEMQMSHLKLHHFSAKIDRLNGETHLETFTRDEILNALNADSELKIELSRYLDVPRRKENTKEEKEYIIRMIDLVFNRAPEKYIEDLSKEKDEITKYINEVGYDGATSLVVVLRK